MNLAYELAVRYPERYDLIVELQRARISDSERRRQFDYIIRASHPDSATRDALFAELLEPENRRTEPWAATVLSLLNHPLREQEAIKYIRPALEELREVQRTGDIFFPRNWVGATLGNHRSAEAYAEVEAFFAEHPDYPVMLKNKILQAAHPLYRTQLTER
jgi:aminopeptidase N